MSQGNHQHVFPMPSHSDCYLLQLTKVQGCYSTGSAVCGSHLSTKSRLNMKLKINKQHHGAQSA